MPKRAPKKLSTDEIKMLEMLVATTFFLEYLRDLIMWGAQKSKDVNKPLQLRDQPLSLWIMKDYASNKITLAPNYYYPYPYRLGFNMDDRNNRIKIIDLALRQLHKSKLRNIVDTDLATTQVAQTMLLSNGMTPSLLDQFSKETFEAEKLYFEYLLFSLQFNECSLDHIYRYFDDCRESNKLGFLSVYLKIKDRPIGHSTMLIFDPINRVIEYYDPNGFDPRASKIYTDYIESDLVMTLLDSIFARYKPDYSLYCYSEKAHDLKRMGIQAMANIFADLRKYSNDVCGMFSTWFLYQRIFSEYKTLDELHDKILGFYENNDSEFLLCFVKGLFEKIKIGKKSIYDELLEKYKKNRHNRDAFLDDADRIVSKLRQYSGEYMTSVDFYRESLVKYCELVVPIMRTDCNYSRQQRKMSDLGSVNGAL